LCILTPPTSRYRISSGQEECELLIWASPGQVAGYLHGEIVRGNGLPAPLCTGFAHMAAGTLPVRGKILLC
jgi:hypothetical protein